MADFDIIEDVAKTLPKKGKIKNYKPFIVAGVGLGLFMLYRKSQNPSAVGTSSDATDTGYYTDGVGQSPDLVGVMSDMANQYSNAIEDQTDAFNYKIGELNDQYSQAIENQNQAIIGLQGQLADLMDSQTPTAQVINTQSLNGSSDSGASIYFDGSQSNDKTHDGNQFLTASKIIQATNLSTSEKTTIRQEVAGLGNDGVGYDPNVARRDESRISSDPVYKQSEIDRANLVIKNRLAQGLSIDNQVEYLNKIQNL